MALASCRLRVPPGSEGAPNMMGGGMDDPYKEMARDIRQKVTEQFLNEQIMPIQIANLNGDPRDSLVRILDNSTFECTREPGRVTFFAAAARFNHSCAPSAYADTTRKMCVIRALRDINVGEEVCISYCPVTESLKSRQEKMKAFNFHCDCKRCVEEAKEDPHISVPCKCGKWNFTMVKDTRLYQTCEVCYETFNREESEHHQSVIGEANKKLYEAMRNGNELAPHLKKLSTLQNLVMVGAKDGIPPVNIEAMMLLTNLANCHFFLATKDKDNVDTKELELFHKYKKMSIERFELKHTLWSNQRDVDYFQLMHSVLKAPGLSEADRQEYAQKLVAACTLHFGQTEVPETLVEAMGRR